MVARRGNGEGTIYQRRRDGLWVGQVSTGDGHRGTYYGKTQSEVRRKVTQAVRERDQGLRMARGRPPTLGKWLADWLESLRIGGSVRARTFDGYEGYVRRDIDPAIGAVRLDRLTRREVQRFFDQQAAKGRASATVRQQRAILRRALNVAVQDDIIPRNPVNGTSIRGAEVEEVRPLDPEQVGALLRAAKGTSWHAPLTVAVSTGLRPGELLGLTCGDVDLEARTLRVRQSVQRFGGRLQTTGVKSQRSRRTIPLPAIAVRALTAQLELGPVLPTAYVFRTRSGGPIEPRNFTRAFKRYADRAGLPKTTRLYDLRHSCASLLLAAGEHPRVVAELLGHSTTKLTMDTYSHVLPALARSAADRMDALLASGKLQ